MKDERTQKYKLSHGKILYIAQQKLVMNMPQLDSFRIYS